jgi:hypothetical protein
MELVISGWTNFFFTWAENSFSIRLKNQKSPPSIIIKTNVKFSILIQKLQITTVYAQI